MPQLDQFTYLTQFVWFCVFYCGFYLLLVRDGLPKISRVLKLRAMLVSHQSQRQDADKLDDGLVRESLRKSASYMASSISAASKWCNEMVTSFNQQQPINLSYLSSLGEMKLSQHLTQNTLERCAPQITNLTPNHSAARLYVLLTQRSISKTRSGRKR